MRGRPPGTGVLVVSDQVVATSRRGAVVVETAVVLSVCLVLVFGVYEYGRIVMMKNLLDNAAREGARYAVVHTGDQTTTSIQNWVQSYLAGQDAQLQSLTIQVFLADANGNNIGTWTNAQFGQYIAVQIDADYSLMTPTFLMVQSSVHLRCVSAMYSEAN
jgi:Flp pilus assembly protein TadG